MVLVCASVVLRSDRDQEDRATAEIVICASGDSGDRQTLRSSITKLTPSYTRKAQDYMWRLSVGEAATAAELRLLGFAFAGARHQYLDGFARGFALVQDGVHLFGDGHFHVAGVSQADGGGGGEDAFGDHAVHAGDDFGELLAAAEFDADAAIARQAAGAGEDEVAESGESGHGFGAASAGDDEARHFGQAARDEGGDGVVAEAEAVADSGGDGDGVLQRAAEFHADHVVVGVDAEARVAEFLLHGAQQFGVLRGDGDCRGIAARDFLREGWAAERADRGSGSVIALENIGNHFGHALQRAFFQAFGSADDQGLRCDAAGACVRTARGNVAKA